MFAHAPLRPVTRKERRLKSKPWVTKGILKSTRTKQKLYKIYLKDKSTQSHSKYKKYRNLLTRILELSKKLFYHHSIDQSSNNNKKLWSIVNNIINRKNIKNSSIEYITDSNGNTVKEPTQIGNIMNNNYVNLVDKLLKKYPLPSSQQNAAINQDDRITNSFFMNPITVFDTKNYIKRLNPNKSTRSDLPKILFLKISVEIISPILTEIINRCILMGVFPTSLKIAEVIPIYKNGAKTNCDNYRPISLLSPFSKLIESHIYNNLIKFFNKNNVLYNNQFGFRDDRSTDLAVIDTVNGITKSLDKKLTNCSIFLDLAKAFNSVNHHILLQKLEKYGIRGLPLLLLQSYLKNRQQWTRVNGSRSDKLYINVGVPQGSCLGPLLFLIYINDMHLCTRLNLRLFADDACLGMSHVDPVALEIIMNNELVNVNKWLQDNKLFLNYDKTSYLIFSRKRNKPKFTLTINNHILKQQHCTKYLGITIDDNISWNPHITKLKTQLAQTCFALSKLRKYANNKTMKKVYYSLFYSKIKYCISSWGASLDSTNDPIVKLQKRAIRYVCCEHSKAHTDPLFSRMEMLKFKDIYRLEICKLTHKIKNNHNINNNLELLDLNNIHDYETRLRCNGNFYSASSRTDLGKTCFESMAPRYWREVPSDIKSLNFNSFKFIYKKRLLQLYSHQNNN